VALEVTQDQFLGGRLTIAQPRRGHRSGHDAVLLAAAIPASARTCCELGAGAGVASLCAAWRLPQTHFTAIEIDPALTDLAAQNAAANGLSDRISLLNADICAQPRDLPAAHFDHVFLNPPYYFRETVPAVSDGAKARAHQFEAEDLDLWLRYAAYLLRARGGITVIYRADMLDHLLAALSPRFGGFVVLPIHSRAGQDATRIILRATRDSRGKTIMRPPLVLQNEDATPSTEAETILRHAAALALSAVDG
jgi:tRNA1(Val) A37 N6-methylase TrmN6